mmetsp:Transcript_93381/g.296244  ORF Transcript_93381/g.296244 Transcript_93381/m.296244 type:complete len:305 (-) Transcript_93381:159-1073(-)
MRKSHRTPQVTRRNPTLAGSLPSTSRDSWFPESRSSWVICMATSAGTVSTLTRMSMGKDVFAPMLRGAVFAEPMGVPLYRTKNEPSPASAPRWLGFDSSTPAWRLICTRVEAFPESSPRKPSSPLKNCFVDRGLRQRQPSLTQERSGHLEHSTPVRIPHLSRRGQAEVSASTTVPGGAAPPEPRSPGTPRWQTQPSFRMPGSGHLLQPWPSVRPQGSCGGQCLVSAATRPSRSKAGKSTASTMRLSTFQVGCRNWSPGRRNSVRAPSRADTVNTHAQRPTCHGLQLQKGLSSSLSSSLSLGVPL